MGITANNVTFTGGVQVEAVDYATAPTIGTASRVSGSGTQIDITYTASSSNGGLPRGALGYKNNIAVTAGNSYTVVAGAAPLNGSGGDSYFISTATVKGGGGFATNTTTAGTYTGDGGCNGGVGNTGCGPNNRGGGGGGSSGENGGPTGCYGALKGGGTYGGGGGGHNGNRGGGAYPGGNGAVRILWGTGRAFPSTNVGAVSP